VTATFTCTGCGRITPDIEGSGCVTCDLCEGCTPDAGNCLDCADMRNERNADFHTKYANENEVPC
jgi:hypothetical protein